MRRLRRPRQGVATVELAILLPFLVFIFVIAVDWSRIFYYSLIVTNCARNGALYCSDPVAQAASPYSNVTQAAVADAPNLSPAPQVDAAYGTNTSGPYVDVTVTYTFRTIASVPGVPTGTNVVRTVRMNVAPTLPN